MNDEKDTGKSLSEMTLSEQEYYYDAQIKKLQAKRRRAKKQEARERSQRHESIGRRLDEGMARIGLPIGASSPWTDDVDRIVALVERHGSSFWEAGEASPGLQPHETGKPSAGQRPLRAQSTERSEVVTSDGGRGAK